MTKTYPIISLNGYLYAVEADLFHIGYVLIHTRDSWSVRKAVANKGGYMELEDGTGVLPFHDSHKKIVASNDPSLTDIPKLPEIEEDVHGLALKEYPFTTDVYEPYNDMYRNIWMNGYKAASKEKKYSEEEMEDIIYHILTGDHINTIKSPIELKQEIKKQINHLKSIPKSVEIEMEEKLLDLWVEKENYDKSLVVVKVENGFVKVINWIH